MFTRLPTERSLDQDIEERRQRYTQQLAEIASMNHSLAHPKPIVTYLVYQKTGTRTTKGTGNIASITEDVKRHLGSVRAEEDNFMQALEQAREKYPNIQNLLVIMA